MGRIDPMVRLLVLAIVLATVLPVSREWAAAAQFVSNAAVFLLFLLNGLRLPRHEVVAGMGNTRFLGPLALWVFGAMAALGWAISQAGGVMLPAPIALGFLFLGCLPSTVQSATAYTSLAGGNVASAVVAAALLNVAGVIVSAPLFAFLSGQASAVFDPAGLVKIGTILLLPFILGQLLQGRLGSWIGDHRPLVTAVDRLSIAIAVYVAFSGAVREGIWGRVDPLAWAGVVVACGLFLVAGYGGAWLLGKVAGLARGDRIAMTFAGAQKSVAMGAPLATVLFPPALAGIVLLPTLIYHLAQLVVAAPLATRLREKARA